MAESSRPTLSWSALWDQLFVEEPSHDKTVLNQSMVRMGIALQKSKVDGSFFPDNIHNAMELAEWLCGQTELVGEVKKYDQATINWKNFKGKRGIMFFKQAVVGKGKCVDYIDLWDGNFLKGVDKLWKQFDEVWFWDLWPCTTSASVKVYSKADAKSRSLTSVGRNQHVEVVEVVDETWVKVNLTKFYVVESIGFVKRDSLQCQDVVEKSWWLMFWENYPDEPKPCHGGEDDQCAIRLGVALKKSGVDLSSFKKGGGVTCGRVESGYQHDESHILRAQELAEWLSKQTDLVGNVKKYDLTDKITWEEFKGKRGIIFIMNPHLLDEHGNFLKHKTGKLAGQDEYLGRNHIDLWNKSQLRKGETDWIKGGQKVWFWELE